MKVSRENWSEVEPLLNAALAMDPAPRAAWLAQVDATHPQAAPILRRMLEMHERAESSRELETVPKLASRPDWGEVHAPGERVGPFELVSRLGRGGMGEVWLARQADGRIERDVALKLPALHEQGEVLRERFRRERDILAKLEHPHIAHLYDAGVSEQGQPWLAMEFVKGLSLSEHVAARSLSMPQRLELFRQVLAAVAHAHRHLVVHRDLKPANILIDAAGQVKLLDFGIAKLVDDAGPGASGDLTRMGGRVMTLRYAAPEQVASGLISTATDIYALGVILHELVTGLAPYRAVRDGKPLTDVMLLQEQTVVPSRLDLTAAAARGYGLSSAKQLARLVSGDLDAIVLKAMRREPADRYASIDLLDEDILAHLENRPVKARAGTWRYLAGRFVARHKLPLALFAGAVVMLAANLVTVERERRVAVAEKARAERHLASVRKLANAFIFDVHGKIERLAGSLEARELLVKTSLEYLDSLSSEVGEDPALLFELAAAYRKIGDIQGEVGAANKGNLATATGNYEKAKALFATLERLRPDDLETLREHRKLSNSLARVHYAVADPRWRADTEETIRLAERMAAHPRAAPGDRGLLALALSEKAQLSTIMDGGNPESDAAITRAIDLMEATVRETPDDPNLRRILLAVHLRASSIHVLAGRTPESVREAVGHSRRARELAGELAATFPDDARKLAAAQETATDLAEALVRAGEYREADRTIAEAVEINGRLVAQDPKDPTLHFDRMKALTVAADIAGRLGDSPRAVRLGREALAIATRLPPEVQQSRDVQARAAQAKVFIGYALLASAGSGNPGADVRLARLREARGLLAEGVAFIARMRKEGLGTVPEDIETRLVEALKQCNEAIARLEAA